MNLPVKQLQNVERNLQEMRLQKIKLTLRQVGKEFSFPQSTQNLHDLLLLPPLPLLSSLIVQQQAVTLPELLRFRTPSGKLMDQIGINYWDLGILLLNDAKGAITKAIVAQCNKDAAKINREILQRWIEGQGMPVEWVTLIEVLKDIGLAELAREIEKKYYTEEVN